MKKLLFLFCSLTLLWGCKDAAEKKETATKTGTVNFPVSQREIFSLSMVSNLPAAIAWPYSLTLPFQNFPDSIITNITPFMDSTLMYATDNSTGQKFTLSNWTRVWGPAVIVDSMCDLCNDYTVKVLGKDVTLPGRARVPVSSMTIFKDNNNNYVVGIEATNPSSITDWVTLDLNVFAKQPFDNDSSHGNLSQGTYIGLHSYLLELKDMKTSLTAMQFLQAAGSVNSLTVTGHSLGGALAPVFALYLKNNLTKNNNNIYCLATAGASPGDMTFINYFNQQLGNNTVRIWNTLDVVPHAWEPDTMNLINTIYQRASASIGFDSPFNCKGNTVPSQPFDSMVTPPDIAVVVTGLVSKLNGAGLSYGSICNGGQTFTGTPNSSINYFNTTSPATPSALDLKFPNDMTFIDQLGNQHVAAYSMYFQIIGIHNYMHSWVTGNRLKNGVAWWTCNPSYRKCDVIIPINILAPASAAKLDDKTVTLWGLIQKAAWKW